ncbi:hypothetical protein Tco_1035140, partial [Tanacetum coccineum]
AVVTLIRLKPRQHHLGHSPRTSSEGGLECHFTIGGSPVQARPKRLSNFLYDSPLPGGHTPASDKSSKKLNELTELCTKLFAKVTSLEDELTCTKVVYNKAFITLTKRVKKLEKRLKHKKRRAVINSSEDEEPILDVEDSPKQGRMIVEIDKDENINLVKSSEKEEAHASAEHIMESELDDDDTTLTETFLNIQNSATKASKDMGKAIMTESQPERTTTKMKERQARARFEAAIRLQEQLDEEARQRFARDAEVAKRLQEEFDDAERKRIAQETPARAKQSFSKAEDSGIKKEVMQRSGFDLQQESKTAEGRLKRKTLKDREDITKKQKLDEQAEVQVDSD